MERFSDGCVGKFLYFLFMVATLFGFYILGSAWCDPYESVILYLFDVQSIKPDAGRRALTKRDLFSGISLSVMEYE